MAMNFQNWLSDTSIVASPPKKQINVIIVKNNNSNNMAKNLCNNTFLLLIGSEASISTLRFSESDKITFLSNVQKVEGI